MKLWLHHWARVCLCKSRWLSFILVPLIYSNLIKAAVWSQNKTAADAPEPKWVLSVRRECFRHSRHASSKTSAFQTEHEERTWNATGIYIVKHNDCSITMFNWHSLKTRWQPALEFLVMVSSALHFIKSLSCRKKSILNWAWRWYQNTVCFEQKRDRENAPKHKHPFTHSSWRPHLKGEAV